METIALQSPGILGSFSVVDVLNTGVTGFAVIMLYVAYRLTSQVQGKVLGATGTDFADVAMFAEWRQLVQMQLQNTRFFMLFAFCVFVGGLGAVVLMSEAESDIILSVYPQEPPHPQITAQGRQVEMGETGSAFLKVKSDYTILVYVGNLKRELAQQEERLKAANVQATSFSSEAGL